jgi:hypothetical protein
MTPKKKEYFYSGGNLTIFWRFYCF